MLKIAASSGMAIDAAEEARRGHVAQRIDRHDLHRGELIGGAHQADLGGQRGAGAAGEQQRRDHRPQLLQQPERGGRAERLLRAEALQQRRSPAAPSTMPTNKPDSMMMISERAPAL